MLHRQKGLGVLTTLAVIGLLSVAPAPATTADADRDAQAYVKTRVTIRYFDENGSLIAKRVRGPASEGKEIRPPAKVRKIV